MLNKNYEVHIQRKKLNQEDLQVFWAQQDISQIKKVNVSYNQITNLYLTINNEKVCLFNGFTKLEYLDLSNNPVVMTWGSNLYKLSKLKVLKIENTNLEKEHNLRFLRNLNNIQYLSIKNHKIYNLGLKTFQKITGKLENLIELDIRQIGNLKAKKLREKDKAQLLSFYPCLQKFNGENLDKIKVLKDKPKREKSSRLSVYGKNFLKDQKRMHKRESQKENRVLNFNKTRKNIFDQDSLSNFGEKKFDSDDSFMVSKRGISKSSLDEKCSEKKFVCTFLDDFNKMNLVTPPFRDKNNLKSFFDQNLDQARKTFFKQINIQMNLSFEGQQIEEDKIFMYEHIKQYTDDMQLDEIQKVIVLIGQPIETKKLHFLEKRQGCENAPLIIKRNLSKNFFTGLDLYDRILIVSFLQYFEMDVLQVQDFDIYKNDFFQKVYEKINNKNKFNMFFNFCGTIDVAYQNDKSLRKLESDKKIALVKFSPLIYDKIFKNKSDVFHLGLDKKYIIDEEQKNHYIFDITKGIDNHIKVLEKLEVDYDQISVIFDCKVFASDYFQGNSVSFPFSYSKKQILQMVKVLKLQKKLRLIQFCHFNPTVEEQKSSAFLIDLFYEFINQFFIFLYYTIELFIQFSSELRLLKNELLLRLLSLFSLFVFYYTFQLSFVLIISSLLQGCLLICRSSQDSKFRISFILSSLGCAYYQFFCLFQGYQLYQFTYLNSLPSHNFIVSFLLKNKRELHLVYISIAILYIQLPYGLNINALFHILFKSYII